MRALYAAILERGGYPYLLLELPDQDELFFAHAKDAQLDVTPLFRKLAYEQFESRIRIASSTNPRALSNVDPARQKRRQKASATILETQMHSLYWVELLVQRFEGTLGGSVKLKTQWGLFSKDKRFIMKRQSVIAEPVNGTGYDALVEAMSRALERLSRDIADGIMSVDEKSR